MIILQIFATNQKLPLRKVLLLLKEKPSTWVYAWVFDMHIYRAEISLKRHNRCAAAKQASIPMI